MALGSFLKISKEESWHFGTCRDVCTPQVNQGEDEVLFVSRHDNKASLLCKQQIRRIIKNISLPPPP